MKKVTLSPPKWKEMRITTEEKKDNQIVKLQCEAYLVGELEVVAAI